MDEKNVDVSTLFESSNSLIALDHPAGNMNALFCSSSKTVPPPTAAPTMTHCDALTGGETEGEACTGTCNNAEVKTCAWSNMYKCG